MEVQESTVVDLDATRLLAEAMAETGLSDWGETQGWGLATFLPALQIQLNTIDSAKSLSREARLKVRKKMLRLLSNRLKLVEDRKNYPAMAGIAIRRPIICIGFGRTGSTLIHGLLAEDPNSMTPRYWECEIPASPPPGISQADDPRVLLTGAELKAMLDANPAVGAQHPYYHTQGVQVQAECGHIFEATFSSIFNWVYFGSDAAYDALLFDPAYADVKMDFHCKFLQQLQYGRDGNHGRDRHWTLKAPEHLMALGALIKKYPDAQLVWSHRNLLTTLLSNASVAGIVRSVNLKVDKKEAAREVLQLMKRQVALALEVIKGVPKNQLYHLHYQDMMDDPAGAVQNIYRQFGREYLPEHTRRIQAYLNTNQHNNQFGEHKYSADELGLDEGFLLTMFKDYKEAIGL